MFMATFSKIISWRDGDRVGLFYVLLDVSGLHFSHMLAMFSLRPPANTSVNSLAVATATASLTEKTECFFYNDTRMHKKLQRNIQPFYYAYF